MKGTVVLRTGATVWSSDSRSAFMFGGCDIFQPVRCRYASIMLLQRGRASRSGGAGAVRSRTQFVQRGDGEFAPAGMRTSPYGIRGDSVNRVGGCDRTPAERLCLGPLADRVIEQRAPEIGAVQKEHSAVERRELLA